ncbi:MAG: LacI family DNA-binding transcriptional regulator [Solobacterium sp.]|nr:LacI family DNA-binding transcriptional regulator [Solobacterium sp.]
MSDRITINDIAKLAGVSKTTVSFYLNRKFDKMSEETKLRLEDVISRTNYHPNTIARSLNYKQTYLIGVIIGDITNSFANQIVKGIDEYVRENGYQMIVGTSSYQLENERKCLTGMAAMGVDGFIVQPTVHFETMWNEMAIHKPIVYFDSPNPISNELWIKTNNYEAVLDATEKLLRQGYEQFVMISADPYVLETRMERYRGFTDCLDVARKSYEVILADSKITPDELEQRLLPYIDSGIPTAVFVCNNWLLDKAYLVLRKYRHKIPSEIGLIGFDSLEWTELVTPSITTIVQPAREEGSTAAQILIDRIEGKNSEAPNRILKCRINELDSTRRLGS